MFFLFTAVTFRGLQLGVNSIIIHNCPITQSQVRYNSVIQSFVKSYRSSRRYYSDFVKDGYIS